MRTISLPTRWFAASRSSWAQCLLPLIAAYFAVAVALILRRAAGALVHPLGLESLLVAGLPAALALAGLRIGWRGTATAGSAWLRSVDGGLSVAGMLFAISLSLPTTSWHALTAFWCLMIVTDLGSRIVTRRRPIWCSSAQTFGRSAVRPQPSIAEEPPADDRISQSITRRRIAEGVDVVQGVLKANLAPGQRTSTLHIAFCPPFAEIPHFDFEQGGGPEARVVAGQVLTHGARIDIRLSRAASEATSVSVEVVAEGPALDW